MIHQVPIKSLPQDWLWCETWCDDGSKKSAKTIDLVRAVCLDETRTQKTGFVGDEQHLLAQQCSRKEEGFLTVALPFNCH